MSPKQVEQKALRVASDLLARKNLALKAGLMFGEDRDLYKVYGYKRELSFIDFRNKYERQDIAARIVDAPVQATWRRKPTVWDDSEAIDGPWNEAWDMLVRKYKVYHKLERVDRLAGLGQFSTLLLGLPGELNQPAIKERELLFLQPFGQDSVSVESFETDLTQARYGKPLMYKLKLADPGATERNKSSTRDGRSVKKEVHYSRMLHVAESTLEDEVYGLPKLLKVYNLFDDMLKISGGSAETFWLTANRGMQFDIDKDATLSDDDEAALSDEIDEYFHNLRRFIRTRGVKINSLGTDVANPEGVFTVLIALIAGATGIPVRILLGSERGELASEQDRSNWANRIEERQTHYAQPMILEPLIEMFISIGALPKLKGNLEMAWPDAFAPSPLERAQTMAQKARAATNLSKALDSEAAFITPEEAREIMGLKAGLNASEMPDQEVDTPEEDAEGQPTSAISRIHQTEVPAHRDQ